jgi:hypothetical protein
LLDIVRTVLLSNGARDLTITGIDFVYTAWGGPDQPCGYVPTQAGWGNRPLHEPHSLGPISPSAPVASIAVDAAASNLFVIGKKRFSKSIESLF